MSDTLERQIALEHAARDAGRDRFLRNLRKATEADRGDETAAGVAILRRTLEPVALGIEKWVADSLAGCAGRRATAAVALEGVDPYLVAYLALSQTLSGIGGWKRGRSLSGIALGTARSLEHELRMAAFEEQQPALYGTIMRRLADRGSTPQHTERVAVYSSTKYGIEWAGWAVPQMLHIGMAVLDVLIPVTGLFEVKHVKTARNRTPATLSPRPELVEWLNDRNGKLELLKPVLMPMVIPPRPWNGIFGGGYRSDAISKAPIVKRMSKDHRAALEAADLSKVTVSGLRYM